MIKITTRSGEHLLLKPADRYTILADDNFAYTVRAADLKPGHLLMGAGRILRIERLEST